MSVSNRRDASGPSWTGNIVNALENRLDTAIARNKQLVAKRDELARMRVIDVYYGKPPDNIGESFESINIYDLGYDPAKWRSHADWMAGAPPMDTAPPPGRSLNWPAPVKSQSSSKNQSRTHAF